jgi:hypothetical protein
LLDSTGGTRGARVLEQLASTRRAHLLLLERRLLLLLGPRSAVHSTPSRRRLQSGAAVAGTAR